MKLKHLLTLLLLALYGCDSPQVVDHAPIKETIPVPETPLPGPTDTVKVGLLLPLSGKTSDLGKQLLNAAQLALFSFPDHHLELLPKDTKGDPTVALTQTQDLLNNGVELILGPLFAHEVDGLRAPALANMVPIVSLTNNIDKAGQGVFVFGFSPDINTQGILNFARKKGYKHFAALLPSTPFGKRLAENITAFTTQNNFPAPTILYSPPDSRSFEFELEKLKTTKTQVLFVPEGGARILEIVAYLKDTSLGHLRLLGSGQWDDPVVSSNPQMEGAWYASSNSTKRDWFNKTYEETYGEKPQRLTSLAFDMVSLAIVLSKDTTNKKPFTYQTLVRTQGFRGVEGLFKIQPNGQTQRELSIFQIQPGGVREIGKVVGDE
jgi:ABC-type branched-subunit amino acid transport system substrate-binding protein